MRLSPNCLISFNPNVFLRILMNLLPAFIRRRIEHRPNLLKIVGNIGWLFFDKILRMGVGLIVGVWVARYLGPEQFGQLNFAIAFVGLFGAIASLGLENIVVREVISDPSRKEVTLGTAAMLQFIGGMIAYGLIIGTIFLFRPDDSITKTLVVILGASMLFKFNEIAVCWFESQVKSKYVVWVQNSCFLILASIKVLLILKGAQLIAFAWVNIAEALLVAVFISIMLHFRGLRLYLLRIQIVRAKQLLTDSWPLFLSSIAIIVYMRIDQVMLGQMIGGKAVGIYAAATKISEIWYFIPVMIVASVYPSILEAKKLNEEQYYQRFQQLFDLLVWLSISVSLAMTFLAKPIIMLLFGSGYAESSSVLAIHIWASVFVCLGVASGRWFVTENKQVLSLQRTILGAVINIIFNLLLIPSFGTVGAALATIVAYAMADFFSDAFHKQTKRIFYMKLRALIIFSVIKRVKSLKV